MRKTIAGLMAQGMSLEDIHMQMEEIFNEEYKKREQEQKALEIAAARDRVACAFIDYLAVAAVDLIDLDSITVEEVGQMLDESIDAIRMKLDIMEAFGAPEKVEIKRVDADDVDSDSDEAIRKFLMGLGFQPMN